MSLLIIQLGCSLLWNATSCRLCLSCFPRVETCFNTHYQNAYASAFRNAFLELLRLSSNSIVSTSREAGLVTAQLHCAVWPIEQRSCTCIGHTPLRRSVGDIKAFQNNFAFIISAETCSNAYQIAHFSAFQKGVSDPLIKTALRLSSAKITLKVVWKP